MEDLNISGLEAMLYFKIYSYIKKAKQNNDWDYYDGKEKKHYCIVRYNVIKKLTGLNSDASVSKLIKKLENKELIYHKKGYGNYSRYFLKNKKIKKK